MSKVFEWLSGKKTYILMGLAVVTAVVTWAVGDIGTQQMVEAIFAAFGAMTLRAGVAKS